MAKIVAHVAVISQKNFDDTFLVDSTPNGLESQIVEWIMENGKEDPYRFRDFENLVDENIEEAILAFFDCNGDYTMSRGVS